MKRIILFFVPIFLFACSSKDGQNSDTSNSTGLTAINIADSNFAFKNISNSEILKYFFRNSTDGNSYTDSTKKIILKWLNDPQKIKLIAPLPLFCNCYADNTSPSFGIDNSQKEKLIKHRPHIDTLEANYLLSIVRVYFVSKQDPVGDFTPIIVWIEANSYGALYYVLIDKTNSPVSYLALHGGNCTPTWYEYDKEPVPHYFLRHAALSKNTIHLYDLKVINRIDSAKNIFTVDSFAYVSKIQPNGTILTIKTDSARYKRVIRWKQWWNEMECGMNY